MQLAVATHHEKATALPRLGRRHLNVVQSLREGGLHVHAQLKDLLRAHVVVEDALRPMFEDEDVVEEGKELRRETNLSLNASYSNLVPPLAEQLELDLFEFRKKGLDRCHCAIGACKSREDVLLQHTPLKPFD